MYSCLDLSYCLSFQSFARATCHHRVKSQYLQDFLMVAMGPSLKHGSTELHSSFQSLANFIKCIMMLCYKLTIE